MGLEMHRSCGHSNLKGRLNRIKSLLRCLIFFQNVETLDKPAAIRLQQTPSQVSQFSFSCVVGRN